MLTFRWPTTTIWIMFYMLRYLGRAIVWRSHVYMYTAVSDWKTSGQDSHRRDRNIYGKRMLHASYLLTASIHHPVFLFSLSVLSLLLCSLQGMWLSLSFLLLSFFLSLHPSTTACIGSPRTYLTQHLSKNKPAQCIAYCCLS